MISADVKANKNNKKYKIWWLYLTNFYKMCHQNMKYNIKGVCIFHLILVNILSMLILSIIKSHFLRNTGKAWNDVFKFSFVLNDDIWHLVNFPLKI